MKPVIKVETAIDEIIPISEVFGDFGARKTDCMACTWISDDILAIIVESGWGGVRLVTYCESSSYMPR